MPRATPRITSQASHRRGNHRDRSASDSGSKQEQSRTTQFLGAVNSFSGAESRISNPIPGRDDDQEEGQEEQLDPDYISMALRTAQTSCGNVGKVTRSMRGRHAKRATTALSVLQTSAMLADRAYNSRKRQSSTGSAGPIAVDEPPNDQSLDSFYDTSTGAGSGFDATPSSQTQGYFTPRQAWDQYRSPSSTPSALMDRYSLAGQRPVESEPWASQFGRPGLSRQSTIASMTSWPSEQPTPVETPSPTRSRRNTTRGVLGYENKYHMSTSDVLSLGWGPAQATAAAELAPTEDAEEGEEGSVYLETDGYTDGSMAFAAGDGQNYYPQT